MKLKIDSTALSNALDNVIKAVSKQANDRPILTHVALFAENNILNLKTFNMEMEISQDVPCEVELEGSITIPAILLRNHVSLIDSDKELQLDVDYTSFTLHLQVTGESNVANFKGLDYDEFPLSPSNVLSDEVQIKSTIFKSAIKKVVYAAAPSGATMITTTGCRLTLNDKDSLSELIAADGSRLSQAFFELENPLPDGKKSVSLVSAKCLSEITGLLSDDENAIIEVAPSSNKSYLMIKMPNIIISIGLIAGNYPAVESFIPTVFSTSVVLNKKEFEKILNNMLIFSSKENDILKISLSKIDDNTMQLTLFSQSDNNSDIERSLVVNGSGAELTFLMSARFIKEAISNTDDVTFIFEIGSDTVPKVIIRPNVSSKTIEHKALILPRIRKQ